MKDVLVDLIRFYMEGCIEICVNLYITLFTLKKDYFTTYSWETFSTIFCMFTALQMVLLPVFLGMSAYYFATQYKTRGERYRQIRYLFADFRPRLLPALYYFFFIMRRYLFVISLIQLKNTPTLQVSFYLYSSLLM